jgi:hypothetical protein
MVDAVRALAEIFEAPDCALAALDASARLEEGVSTDAVAALLAHADEMDGLGMLGAATLSRVMAVRLAPSCFTRSGRLDLAARLDVVGLHVEAERVVRTGEAAE